VSAHTIIPNGPSPAVLFRNHAVSPLDVVTARTVIYTEPALSHDISHANRLLNETLGACTE